MRIKYELFRARKLAYSPTDAIQSISSIFTNTSRNRVGHKTGRQAVADFVRDSGRMIERISFEVHDVLANNDRAVILGGLSTRIKSTGKIIDTAFAIILTIVGSEITRFVMLEDSFKTSEAARDAAL